MMNFAWFVCYYIIVIYYVMDKIQVRESTFGP